MKIVASDFDGTINYNGKISNEDKDAIKRFRREGNKFGIVTGRDVELSSWIRQGDGFDFDFLISCTGGAIKNSEGELIYIKKGKIGEFIFDIIEKAKELGATFFAISDVLLKCYIDTNGKIPIQLDSLKEFTHANCSFPSDEKAQELTDYVNSNYSDLICAHRNGWSVDMPPANTSKVTGIYEYARMFEGAQIYAVGDNVNDISMIKEFNGYAVSNAAEAVKAVAPNHCNRVADMLIELMEEK